MLWDLDKVLALSGPLSDEDDGTRFPELLCMLRERSWYVKSHLHRLERSRDAEATSVIAPPTSRCFCGSLQDKSLCYHSLPPISCGHKADLSLDCNNTGLMA